MKLIDRLQAETEGFHPEADEDLFQLLGAVRPSDYRRFLTRTFGFVQPLERSIVATTGIEAFADLRRFEKHHLLRRDLIGFRITTEEIDRLPKCSLPLFNSPEEALGWAYVVERSTLGHGNLFRHLASVMPGEVAFTSTYVKCYFGAIGENWNAFARSLDSFADRPELAQRLVEAAKAGFRMHRSWRHIHDDHMISHNQGAAREQQFA